MKTLTKVAGRSGLYEAKYASADGRVVATCHVSTSSWTVRSGGEVERKSLTTRHYRVRLATQSMHEGTAVRSLDEACKLAEAL